jgi:uncharacterized protein with HEPN domain
MGPEEDDVAFLFDLLEAAETVVRFIGSRAQADYDSDEQLRAAVERKIEIVGEACRGISRQTQEAHPENPWRKVAATRHVLVHEYNAVNDQIIWRIATVYVPDLIAQLKRLIPPIPDGQEGG